MSSSSSSSSSSAYDATLSNRYDRNADISSSSTTEDDEHAGLYHKFDSIKSIVDKMYGEITHSKSNDCLHENFNIDEIEGRGRKNEKN